MSKAKGQKATRNKTRQLSSQVETQTHAYSYEPIELYKSIMVARIVNGDFPRPPDNTIKCITTQMDAIIATIFIETSDGRGSRNIE